MEFARPEAPAPQEEFKNFAPKDAEGHLLAIEVQGVEDVQTNDYGVRPAVRAHITDIDEGERYEDQLIFGAVVVPVLSAQVGSTVLGRWVKGEKRGGNNPPWLIKDFTDADLELAQAYFDGGKSKAVRGKGWPSDTELSDPAESAADDDIEALQRKLEEKQKKLLASKLGAKAV